MSTGLRREVYRGGGYLAFRQGAGLVLSAAGVLLLTRLLGPAQYGIYAAALTLQGFVQILANFGVGTWLVRHEGDDDPERYHHASSFLLVAGLLAVAAALLALPLVEGWTRLEHLDAPALALFAAIPLQLVASVPMARIERSLDFRSVARIELGGQLAFFLVAVPLAAAGTGFWAPVSGFWAQQTVQAFGYFHVGGYRPRWSWSPAANRAMLRFGTGYSASLWIWQARRLANPLIVGRYLGSEGVGYVAVATQIATQLGFVAVAVWRLSTATLARLQGDAARTASAIREGMHLQALAVGPPLVAFAWLGGWLVPHVFGAQWTPIMRVFPAIALGYLTNSVFLLHSSALYVRQRTWQVSIFHVANVALLGGTAALLVPRLGLAGYAWAEIAAIGSYLALYVLLRRMVGRIAYAPAAAVWGAFAVALAIPGQAWASALLIAAVLVLRPTRTLVMGMWQEFRRHAYDG